MARTITGSASQILIRPCNGPHHCAGAHLSRRTVGAILLPMLFERFPNMTVLEPASVRWHGFGFRGPLNLPLLLQ
jgi:cytochrome P450